MASAPASLEGAHLLLEAALSLIVHLDTHGFKPPRQQGLACSVAQVCISSSSMPACCCQQQAGNQTMLAATATGVHA